MSTPTRYGKHVAVYYSDELPDEFKEIVQGMMCSGDSCYVLVKTKEDGTVLEILGVDGGEPEDQCLVRDLEWVAQLADSYETKINQLEKEVEYYRNLLFD